MTSSPTKRQAEYLAFIRAFTVRRGMSPSFEDLAQHFLTTAPTVNGMIKTLEAKGFLTRVPGQARTLRIVVPLPDPEVDRPSVSAQVATAARFACLVAEHLVPVVAGPPGQVVTGRGGLDEAALDAVARALDAMCAEVGASADDAAQAQAVLQKAIRAARRARPPSQPSPDPGGPPRRVVPRRTGGRR